MMWKHAFGILVLVFAAMPAKAEEYYGFYLLNAQSHCTGGIKGPVCHHYFGGDTAETSFGHAEVIKDCPKLKAELVQISTRLEAPVPDAVKPAASTACDGGKFSVTLPEVRSETEFEVVFSEETGKDKWTESRRIGIRAYPRTLMDSVRSWSEYENNMLVVKDGDSLFKAGTLTDFLDRHKVKYVLRDMGSQGTSKVSIVVGKDAEQVDGDAIYLRETYQTMPSVKIRQTAEKTTAEVRMELLGGLAGDNPLAQKTFVEIFNEIAK